MSLEVKRFDFCLIWPYLSYCFFFGFFAWMIFTMNDLERCINLIILIPIGYDFRGQKVNFLPVFAWFGHILIFFIRFFWFFAWMIFTVSDLDWCINLIILTPSEHNFRGQKVNRLPHFCRFDCILSSLNPTFFIFCINEIYHKWFILVYKVDNFDP